MSNDEYYPDTPDSWIKFYSTLTLQNTLPSMKEEADLNGETSRRDLVLDLSNIEKDSSTFAYGDVLTLSSNDTTFDFSTHGGFLFIVGRTFSATTPRQLKIKVGRRVTKFICYIAEVQKPLTVIFTNGSKILDTRELEPEPDHLGCMITYHQLRGMSFAHLKTLDDRIQKEAFLERLFQTQLRIASLTMFTNPNLSRSILHFICRLTFKSAIAAVTHFEASTILGQLLAEIQHAGDPDVWFVPSVTMAVYEDPLETLLSAASLYAGQYNRFMDRKADTLARHDAVRAMAQENKGASIAQIQLLSQAKTKWEDTLCAVQVAQGNAEATEREIGDFSKKFINVVKEWGEKQAFEAVLMVASSAISCSLAVGSILAGNIGAVSNLINSISEIRRAISNTENVLTLCGIGMENMMKKVEAIRNFVKLLNETIEDSQRSIDGILSGNFDLASHVQSLRLNAPDPDGINAVTMWDIWAVEIRNSMQMAIDAGIPTTTEYADALKRQAIYGKAQCLTKVAAAKAGQEYARALLQCRRMDVQHEHLENWVSSIQEVQEKVDEQSAAFFDRLLSIKTFVLTQLRNYMNSFTYVSLRKSAVVLDMNKSLLELQMDVATVKGELAGYLSAFCSDPQPFSLQMISDELPLYQKLIVAELQSTNQFTMILDKDNRGPFAGLLRVRLDGLRIWLDGAKPKDSSGAIVKLGIQTNGLYGDSSESDFFTFSTKPLKRTFWYRWQGADRGKILVDAVVPSVYHNAPTPFTQWTVSLINPGDIDLSGLTSITFEWVGTAYGI